jgi:ABC-type multidrug transport system ATPase subunit
VTSNASVAVLQVQCLSFSYPGRHVFDGWTADFAPGLSWVRGSNGSGKSTLLKLLAGALPPLLGRLAVRGIDAAEQPLAYRRQVFWCGPAAIAFDHLRAPEYFGFLRGLYPRLDVGAVQEHVEALGLARFMGARVSELSTGTQRKVWLAAALSAGTSVTLLDEPLTALDQASLGHVLAQLARCAADRERAWIVASHEGLGAAAERARVIELDASCP